MSALGPGDMPGLAARAVEAVRAAEGRELDRSPDSLRTLDRTLQALHDEGYSSATLGDLAVCFGAYLGEVLVDGLGGRWVDVRGTPAAGHVGALVVEVGDAYANPIGRALGRLDGGETESLALFYEALAARCWPPG